MKKSNSSLRLHLTALLLGEYLGNCDYLTPILPPPPKRQSTVRFEVCFAELAIAIPMLNQLRIVLYISSFVSFPFTKSVNSLPRLLLFLLVPFSYPLIVSPDTALGRAIASVSGRLLSALAQWHC